MTFLAWPNLVPDIAVAISIYVFMLNITCISILFMLPCVLQGA